EEALLHYLRRQLKRDPDDFMAVFSKIEADVMMSSELVNNLPADMSEIWGTDGEKLGPVLKTAWIDMIPYNAFWADGSIRYYDQEFAVENCPARYVLFRALFYTWIHIPEAESILPLETVKKQFELEELWDGFYRCEMKFVSENRNWSSLAEIYTHNYPDRDEIKRNINNLMTSAGLREVHAVQLELLKELDRVCRKHQLKYMAIHGTLLGAVRHRGFVPWDDDVDVAMLRDDYERLISMADSGFSPSFFLQTVRNNFNCYYGGYCKLRRDGTAAYEPQNEGKTWNSCHQGIWIDIFPIDGCPVDNNSRERQQRTISFMQRIIYAKTYPIKKFVPDDVPGSTVSLYYILAKCTRRRWLLNWIDTLCRSNKDSPKRAILECYYGKKKNGNVWDAEAVGDTVEVPFEDMMIPVPAGWGQILRSRYGEDFMTPIAKKHRRGHKGIIFITDMEKEQNGYS
ncbi:MAG: LicD family protein, partial [Oscillospiraceae bacterium]|nr:LicD family protein [Oscillospiraceae bacterium]